LYIDFEQEGIAGWIQSRPFSWDTSTFDALSGRYSLKHIYDNPNSGMDQISICVDSLHIESGETEWQFKIRHDYTPSAANSWAVFLVSKENAKEMYPGGYTSGYAIGVNYHGSDDLLKLWKVDKGEENSIITTGLNWQEEIGMKAVGIKVNRSGKGAWKIFVDRQGTFEEFIEEGSGTDAEFTDMRHFGVFYNYSSRQDLKLWIDDIIINGRFERDTIPPTLICLNISDERTLMLFFSEAIDENIITDKTNFFVEPETGYPEKIWIIRQDQLVLSFEQSFPDGISCKLQIRNIKDKNGNIAPASEHDFVYYIPKKNDVIINEIMADPSPSVGLPEYEYIELMNRSDYHIDMNQWTMECGNTIVTFPEILLPPASFLLLISTNAEEQFKKYGSCVPVFTSRTSLQNTGDLIKMLDKNRNLITWLNYSDEWYSNDFYRRGGWSLERKDPDRFCGGIENWSVSENSAGGTPGRLNSVNGLNPDTVKPRVLFVEIPDDSRLEIYFSEPMDSVPQIEPEYFNIDHDIGNPEGIILRGPDYQSVLLELSVSIEPGKIYHLTLSDELKDCAGNRLSITEPVKIGKPEFPSGGDILISEIMFDPLPGKVEFLELYNHSGKVINLGCLLVAKRDKTTGEISSLIPVDNGNRLLFPGDFLLLTSDIPRLISGYPGIGGIQIEVPGMPAFENNQGTVVILDLWLNIIDEFEYHYKMHFSLLTATDGVSLERISYKRPANDPDNWHSAAENVGFCTPGYTNSQSKTNTSFLQGIKIEPEIFTPDNDGKDDFANIWYSFDHPGCVASIWIFDPAGRIVRKLADNQLVGESGSITWDGINDLGQRASIGIYMVFIRIFDLEGRVREVKKTCILSVGRK